MIEPLLSVSGVTKTFGGVTAVRNCTFTLAPNSVTGLIGPNGAGKTTMFDILSGHIFADKGTIYFRDKNLMPLPPHQRARLGIARTFQSIRIFRELTALENVLLAFPSFPHLLREIFSSHKKTLGHLRHEAHEFLKLVHLDEKALHKAGLLSYGQQKLLEITRAMATGADVFLLDEPAAGVNRTMLHSIEQLIHALHEQGKTIIIVEHDMPFVMKLSHHIIVMDQGSVIAEGTPHEIQNNPAVLEAYLGHKKIPHA